MSLTILSSRMRGRCLNHHEETRLRLNAQICSALIGSYNYVPYDESLIVNAALPLVTRF